MSLMQPWQRWRVSAPLVALTLLIPGANAEDWPMWGRTPGRNMVAAATGLPKAFDAGKYKPGTEDVDLATTRNVVWVAKLGSQSYGNTVVAQGRVFIGTNNDNPRDLRHEGDRSILLCLEEATGNLLWQFVVPKLKAGRVNDWESLGLLSSPLVEGKRVFLVTSRGEVACLDRDGLADGNDGPFTDEAAYAVRDTEKPPLEPGPRDADIVWVYDMMDELGVFPHNAANSSPLAVGQRVYVCTSNGQDWTHANTPSPFSPSFIALNKQTGALEGEDATRIGRRLFHGQWSSVASGVVSGRPLIFCGGGDGFLYALDATPTRKGETMVLETVWSYDCNPPEYRVKDGKPIKYPSAEGPSEINATPVFYKNRVYVATGQDPEHGEGVGHLVCVDATGRGDVTATATVWSYKGIHRSLSTVSIDPATGLLFIADFSGYVHCLDAETGALHWIHDMKAHIWGSTLVADGKVYLGDEDGDVAILDASKEKRLLSETNLNAPAYASPVVANGTLYVASNTHLYAVRNLTPAATATAAADP
ncbi:MAG TPA: PQQ-binding-like beta-propeller repeat protein [Verrucomicrobiota bacterium]|nr:PQQ-binding-like beta-propeller repeat protein [Verrucomicrobiota bacterium]HNU53186.1 PQQ-binding-like beta-propeller repeat protein [Verrucomicrobiota bacterium]